MAPGKAKKWRLLAAILARTSRANVNFMQITPEILEKELLPHLEKERYLPLKYVNLNDNKELCKTKAGCKAQRKARAIATERERGMRDSRIFSTRP